ncbi:MAG: hypothetical protein FJZ60_02880 [Chlamydiae bacterium]|nr:hypothetical protein [Chlamydiota bacterium]
MKIIDTLYHPEESIWKSRFLRFTWLRLLVVSLIAHILNFSNIASSPIDSSLPLSPQACAFGLFAFDIMLNLLIAIMIQKQSIEGNKTGFITFLFAMNALVFLFFLFFYSLYFTGKLHPLFLTVIEKNLSFTLLSELVLRPIWLFFCWKVRRINQLNQIRHSIESSPEAMQLLENLESPRSKENIQQVVNYLLFRIPHSQQNLIKPLQDEANRRLAFSK